MAEKLFTASIACFILAGAFFIVAVFLFFSLQIQDTARRLMGQTQMKWIMKNKTKEVRKKKKNPSDKKNNSSDLSHEDIPTVLDEELPTVLDSGEAKQGSLVTIYDEDILTEVSQEKITLYSTPVETRIQIQSDMESPTSEGSVEIETDVETEDETDEDEEETVVEEATEEPDDNNEFIILKSIIFIHTDEKI